MTHDELRQWSEDAADAGDAATMLIADIASGEAAYLDGMSAQEIERAWPTVTDSSSGKEIAALFAAGAAAARKIADTWGSPYSE